MNTNQITVESAIEQVEGSILNSFRKGYYKKRLRMTEKLKGTFSKNRPTKVSLFQ